MVERAERFDEPYATWELTSAVVTDLTLRRGTDNNLAHVNIGGLLDREHDGSGDRVGRDRPFVHAIPGLGLSFRTGSGFRENCSEESPGHYCYTPIFSRLPWQHP